MLVQKSRIKLTVAFKLLFIVFTGLSRVTCVRINRLLVPEVTKLGDPVVLDCDYTLEESEDVGLVVKWFFNEKPTPIYQWIPNIKPQETGILRGRLNLGYTASKDTNSVHRALHIIQPGPDLSGNYTCLVSTLMSEDRKTKRMLVLVPEKSFELRQEYNRDGHLKVTCYAEGIFPQPFINLRIGNNSEMNNSKVTVQERNGLFDVRISTELPSLDRPEEFSCELHISQANYTVRKKAIYYPVSGAQVHTISVFLGLFRAATFSIVLHFGILFFILNF